MDSPILLINLNGKVTDLTSEFVINDRAVEIIESMDAPIGVISVAGLYRTGKSFILNQLAGRTDGFDIGSSIQPQTQGIWMWALDKETLRRRNLPDNMNIILLDTEGLGSFTKTETHDVKIFALAVLLSSFLVYNSLGTIDDNAVENMSLIVNLTRSIREKVAESDAKSIDAVDPVSLRQFFPRFMWLLRDFSLELKLEGRSVSEDEYLEHALRPLDGSGQEIAIKNKVRETIKSVFHQRSCYTLKRPVDDEDDLQSLGSLPLSQFRPDYIEEVKRLIKMIYQNTPPKSLYGTNFSGTVLVAIMRQYVNSINSGSVPVISSAWESVLARKTEMAIQEAKAVIINEHPKPAEVDDYLALLGPTGRIPVAEQKGMTTFLCSAVLNAMNPSQLGTCLEEIHHYASENASTLIHSIIEECNRANTDAATNTVRQVKLAIDGAQSIADIKTATEAGEADFLKLGKGRNATAILFDAGWTTVVLAGASKLAAAEAERINLEYRERYEDEMDKANSKYDTLQELYQTVEKEWQKEQANAKTFREQATDLRYEIINHQKTIQALESNIVAVNDLKEDLESQIAMMETKFKTEEEVRHQLELDLVEMTRKCQAVEDACKELSSSLKDAVDGKGTAATDKEVLIKEIESRKMTNDALRSELDQAYEMIEKVKTVRPAQENKQVETTEVKADGCTCVVM